MTAPAIPGFALAVAALTCLSGCDGCQGSAASNPSGNPATSAQGSAGASKSDAPGAGLRVRVKRAGPRTRGQDFPLFTDSVLPVEAAQLEAVKPHVSALLSLLDAQRAERKAAGTGDLSIDLVVNPDVHPTGLVDLATLVCPRTSGHFRFLTATSDAEAKLESFSPTGCPGPKMPDAWSCASVKLPPESAVLHVRGAPPFDLQQTTVIPVTLEHNGSEPDWAGLSARVKQGPDGANCIRWAGARGALSVEQLQQGIAQAWRDLGRRVPVVYVPTAAPE